MAGFHLRGLGWPGCLVASMLPAALTVGIAVLCAVPDAGADVRWLEKDYDFGTMREEAGPKEGVSRFINLGPDTVSLFSVRPSCGCTRADWDDSPVAPGDTVRIAYTYDPHLMPGRFDKSVKVMLSDGSRHTIRIRGNVVGTPETLSTIYPLDGGEFRLSETGLNLGETAHGRRPIGFVNAYVTASDTVWLDARTSSPGLTAVPDRPKAGPGDIVTFTVAFDTREAGVYGPLEENVTVSMSGGRGEATLPVKLYVVPDAMTLMTMQGGKNPVCEPAEKLLDIGMIGPGREKETLDALFTLSNPGKGTLEIYRIVSPRAGIRIKNAPKHIKPGKKATVKVEIDVARLPGGPVRDEITILSSDPRNPRLTLPVAYMKK